ncbi:hypothetical protein T484DRAFT_1928989, partial [Baffinella frigidus]
LQSKLLFSGLYEYPGESVNVWDGVAYPEQTMEAGVSGGEPSLSKWVHAGADTGVSDEEYGTWFMAPGGEK